MKYENIKRAKLTRVKIAKALGYLNVNSFNTSSANGRIMDGLDYLIGEAYKAIDTNGR